MVSSWSNQTWPRKPDAITEIKRDTFKEKIWPLDAAELLYVGRATENKLAQYGICTNGDLAKASPDTLRHMLGINGLKLWMYANGTNTSRVMHKDYVSPVKSIGHGITCTQTPEEVFRVILELSQDVGHRLCVHELMARGVQVSIQTNGLYGSQYQCTVCPSMNRVRENSVSTMRPSSHTADATPNRNVTITWYRKDLPKEKCRIHRNSLPSKKC